MDNNSKLSDTLEGWRESIPLQLSGIEEAYGGYIGEGLSGDSPNEVWEWLRANGITQFIDPSYKYNWDIEARCAEYGIRYFNYPIDIYPETILKMTEKFRDFSDLLSEGHFYMQGRFNSYIALCIFFAFGGKPGLYPIELREKLRGEDEVKRVALSMINAIAECKEKQRAAMSGDAHSCKELHESQRDFKDNQYLSKASWPVFDFTRGFRNGDVVYDVSVSGLGVLGYIYPSGYEWQYDIIMRPSASGKAYSFYAAQLTVVKYLCRMITTFSGMYPLPESTKTALIMMKILFGYY